MLMRRASSASATREPNGSSASRQARSSDSRSTSSSPTAFASAIGAATARRCGRRARRPGTAQGWDTNLGRVHHPAIPRQGRPHTRHGRDPARRHQAVRRDEGLAHGGRGERLRVSVRRSMSIAGGAVPRVDKALRRHHIRPMQFARLSVLRKKLIRES